MNLFSLEKIFVKTSYKIIFSISRNIYASYTVETSCIKFRHSFVILAQLLHSVKITEICFFDKNFVKVKLFTKSKLLKSWFHEIFLMRVNFSFFHTVIFTCILHSVPKIYPLALSICWLTFLSLFSTLLLVATSPVAIFIGLIVTKSETRVICKSFPSRLFL